MAPEILAAYDPRSKMLARLGAEIVNVDLPSRFADFTLLTSQIIGAEAYLLVGDLVDDMTLPIDEAVRPRIRLARKVSAREYLGALREREALKGEFAAAFAGFDALLTPTTQMRPSRVDEVDQAKTPAHFTRFVNLSNSARWPCPNGFTATGCRPRCRSSAAAMTRIRRCASAGPISRRPTLARTPPAKPLSALQGEEEGTQRGRAGR